MNADTRIRALGLAEYQGARWVRVDLHLHTPGISTFILPPGAERRDLNIKVVHSYVEQLVTAGVKVAALTDYNGVRTDWFTAIREEAQQKGIVVFPGAELDFGGVEAGKRGLHVLAVFGYDTGPEAINRVISSLDKNPSDPLTNTDGTHRSIVPVSGLVDALDRLRKELNPILILAHCNNNKGAFKSYAPKEQANLVKRIQPEAIEGFTEKDKVRLSATKVVDRYVIDRIASVEFSDPHSLNEIGTKGCSGKGDRYTYLKMSDLREIEALRLALRDSEVMVRAGTMAPPGPSYTRILGMSVEGAGFLSGLEISWSPELTTIIGGRGEGKSAIIETLRYALDLEPFTVVEYRERLVEYSVGSGGVVHVWIETPVASNVTRLYHVRRVFGENPQVFEVDKRTHEEHLVDLPPRTVIGEDNLPLLFGQREIYAIATDQSKRIRLIDDIVGTYTREKQAALKRLKERLIQNARDIMRLNKKLEEKDAKKQRLNQVYHDILIYEKEGILEKLKQMTLLASDDGRFERIREVFGVVAEDLAESSKRIIEYLSEAQEQSQRFESSAKDVLLALGEEISSLKADLQRLFVSAEGRVKAAEDRFKLFDLKWREAKLIFERQYRQIKATVGEQGLSPDHLERLTRERVKLEREMKVFGGIEEELKRVREQRDSMLAQLEELRREMFRVRKDRADELNAVLGSRVRISIDYQGNRDGFMSSLAALFSGSRLDKESLSHLCTSREMPLVDGTYIAKVASKGTAEVMRVFELSESRARQLCDWLMQDDGRRFELELIYPEDSISLYMTVDHAEVPVERLSDGQRATAVLMILLYGGNRMLVVDQPEDDLDNRFIYEGIVRILREQKGKRQILMATHNPNIPVLGNAELVVALKAGGGKLALSDLGSIDKLTIRGAIKDIMEGGEDAFRRRLQKYGPSGRSENELR